MSSPSLKLAALPLVLACALGLQAQELHIKKNVSVNGYVISTVDTSIKGQRSREVSQTPAGTSVILRQCDLRRTVTLNDQEQTYFAQEDPLIAQDKSSGDGVSAAADDGAGRIDVTTTLTDTGERKSAFGYQLRHIRARVIQESSANACTQIHQTLEIDGWYADLAKGGPACCSVDPPIQAAQGCRDKVVEHYRGSGKLGYPFSQTFTVSGPDGKPAEVSTAVAEVTKQTAEAELFEIPKGYRQVSSMEEVRGAGGGQSSAGSNATAPSGQQQHAEQKASLAATFLAAETNPAAAMALQQKMTQQAAAQLSMLNGQSGVAGLPQMMGGGQQPAASTQVAVPKALGAKAPGKIRIGIAPPDAQMGQGNNANADFSTPIRNAIVALMSGPAVEIEALDAHIPIQLQAEAQQKQCDFILYSSVAVKHSSGGFGKFAKFGGMAASMTPMGMAGMGKGMGGAIAAQAASAAASSAAMSAQQQAMNQLSGFNGQIKSKDDVSIQYQLVGVGQSTPALQNALQGKAKSDGEDVLTPLLQQAATAVLTQVTTKK